LLKSKENMAPQIDQQGAPRSINKTAGKIFHSKYGKYVCKCRQRYFKKIEFLV
jgi:hypothetical protein